MIATLMLIHTGAILIISQMESGREIFSMVGQWHLAGVSFAFFAGFCAWINFAALSNIMSERSNSAILYRKDYWPDDNKEPREIVGRIYWLGVCSGLISWALFVVSGIKIVQLFQ